MSDLRERFLTVKQPWSSLIMAGQKDVENRSKAVPSTLPQWRRCPGVSWRIGPDEPGCRDCAPDGPFPFTLWIHAGKGVDHPAMSTADDRLILAVQALGYGTPMEVERRAPRGVLLGHVTVTGCHHANECWTGTSEDEGPTAMCSRWAQDHLYHWTLTGPVALPEPIPMKGMLGLPFLPDDVRAAALAQLEGATA